MLLVIFNALFAFNALIGTSLNVGTLWLFSSNVMSKTKKYKKGDPCSSDLECKDSGFRRCGNSDIEYDGQSYTLKPKGTKKDSQCLGTRESLKEIRILRRTKKNVDENKECITRDNCKPGLRCRKIQDEEGGYNVHRRVCKK